MAIKHVVTLGFGFADGTKFIPTIGFTPGGAAAATGFAHPRIHVGRRRRVRYRELLISAGLGLSLVIAIFLKGV